MIADNAGAVLRPGFRDPVIEAQLSFRALLEAMARPGRIQEIRTSIEPPAGIDVAAAAMLLALLDHDTPLWLELDDDREGASGFFTFHCGCPIATDAGTARFALLADLETPRLERFAPGSAERPELSATVIAQLPALHGGKPMRLVGPGIDGHVSFAPQGVGSGFWDEMRRNAAQFPRGVDLVLVAGAALCGLPRTARVEA